MRLQHYKTFITVMEVLNLTQAAQRLNLSVSAVSKQINELENSLDIHLFERTNRIINPTPEARLYHEKLCRILDDIEEAEHTLKTGGKQISGTLRITLPSSLAHSNLFSLFEQFTVQHPAIRFIFHGSDHTEDLYVDNYDFALRLGHVADHSQLVAYLLTPVTPILCASPLYLEKASKPHTWSDLSTHHLCLPPLESFSQIMRDVLKSHEIDIFSPRVHTASPYDLLYQLIKSGHGIGILLKECVGSELADGKLIPLLLNHPLPKKNLHIVYKKRKQQPAKIQTFINFLKAHQKYFTK